MKKFVGYMHGINLGGWLSQCVHTIEHYDSFIHKEDVLKIASWGMDHVRLPIDYNLVQNEDGSFKEENFHYIDDCLDWCKEAGLNMVLDLHAASGYVFDQEGAGKNFFRVEEKISMFKDLWRELSRRYVSYSDRVCFELLNEVVDEEDNEPWMKIAEETTAIIREYSTDIKILIGSYYNNSVSTCKYIAAPFDENIVYNVHCYDPIVFTHQGAWWVGGMPLDFRMKYGFTKEEYLEIVKENCEPLMYSGEAMVDGEVISEKFFDNIFAEAVEVCNERNTYLYCGEYGVIDCADPEDILAWYKHIRKTFDKYEIGSCAWTYKNMDFGIADERMDGVREELIKYL